MRGDGRASDSRSLAQGLLLPTLQHVSIFSNEILPPLYHQHHSPWNRTTDGEDRSWNFYTCPLLIVDLVSMVENRTDSHLLPCKLPPDVLYYENQTATAHSSLHIRSGAPSSQIDFILGSWLHCELPNGAALNITSLSGFLNSSTDAPNLSIEFIQSSQTSFII